MCRHHSAEIHTLMSYESVITLRMKLTQPVSLKNNLNDVENPGGEPNDQHESQ